MKGGYISCRCGCPPHMNPCQWPCVCTQCEPVMYLEPEVEAVVETVPSEPEAEAEEDEEEPVPVDRGGNPL